MRSLVILLLTVVFSIQAEDGIRHSHKGLEFRRVLVPGAVFRRQTARGSLRCGSSDHELVVWPQRTRAVLHPSVAGCDLLFPAQGHRPTDPVLQSFADRRSEAHTSELQSLMRISYAVSCLQKQFNIVRLLVLI